MCVGYTSFSVMNFARNELWWEKWKFKQAESFLHRMKEECPYSYSQNKTNVCPQFPFLLPLHSA